MNENYEQMVYNLMKLNIISDMSVSPTVGFLLFILNNINVKHFKKNISLLF